MKLHLTKTLLVAIMASTCAFADPIQLPSGADYKTVDIKNIHYVDNDQSSTLNYKNKINVDNSNFELSNGSTVQFEKQAVLKDSEFSLSNGSNIYFHKGVEIEGCSFTKANTGSQYVSFIDQTYVKTQQVKLNGGNKFVSRSGTINFNGDVIANGDNTFIGGVRADKSYIVQSGVQTFTREGNPDAKSASQTIVLKNIGFADGADETAKINVSAVNKPDDSVTGKGGAFGNVSFSGECEISNLEIEIGSYNLTIDGSLTIKETATIREGKVVFKNDSSIILEIDDISDLMDQPTEGIALFGAADDSPMLNVADGVDFSDAKVELLFTENAIDQIKRAEGPITFKLDKVTNLNNIELSLAVQEDLGKTAEEVFGVSTLSTGVYGSTENTFTVPAAVPEPTTATLSLLALAGLCARRRRK